MKTILMTGITGQDGLFLSKKFIDIYPDCLIYGISRQRNNDTFIANLKKLGVKNTKNLKLHDINLNNKDEVATFISAIKPTNVINLAGPSSVYNSFKNPNKTISIEVFRPSTNTVIKGKCYLNTDKELYPIRKYFPPNDIPDYEIFGGFIVMNLTMHHILLKKLHILRYLSYQERLDKGRVIVTHIFPSASIHNYNVLSEIEFITEINEKKISTVQQFRKYILDKSLYKKKKNIETGKIDLLLKIKTYCNTDFEQPIKTVVEETFHLSKIYKYPISPFHIKLKKRFLQKV